MPKFSFLSKNLVCNLDHYIYDFENFLTLSMTLYVLGLKLCLKMSKKKPQKWPEAMPKFSFLSKNLVCNLDHYLYDFENFLTLSKTSDCTRSKTLPKSVKNLKRGRRLCPNFHF